MIFQGLQMLKAKNNNFYDHYLNLNKSMTTHEEISYIAFL